MNVQPQDLEAAKILADFLPDRIFDAHAHLFDTALMPSLKSAEGARVVCGPEEYCGELAGILGSPRQLRLNVIGYPDRAMAHDRKLLLQSDAFLQGILDRQKDWVGEILVTPEDSEESLNGRLTDGRIRGFKCYHLMANRDNTWNAGIGEYLPEDVWAVAHERKMCITLHMVKDLALADEENWKYIRRMAKKYPDAVLILAHAARAFAAWTGIESVDKVADLDNVWFDFSAVCESPAMLQIVKKAGIGRCMWGSDYPVCRARGKAISLADSFYWIYQKDLDRFSSKTPVNHWLIAVENLMAVRQLCMLADLTPREIEALFYQNAAALFDKIPLRLFLSPAPQKLRIQSQTPNAFSSKKSIYSTKTINMP